MSNARGAAASTGEPATPEQSPGFAAFCAELSDTLARPAERKRNLCRLADALGRLAGASVALCTAGADGLLHCEVGTDALAQLEGDVVPGEWTLEGEAFAAGVPRATENLRGDPRAYLPAQRNLPDGPAVAVPLRMGTESAGVALLARPKPAAEFGTGELAAIQLAATLLGGALHAFAEHERVRASRAVLEALRSVQGRDVSAAKGVLRAVRHELNTPVAVILGNLQLCASDDPAEWKLPAKELWQAIRTGAARLEDLSRLLRTLDESESPIELDAQGRFLQPNGAASANGKGSR